MTAMRREAYNSSNGHSSEHRFPPEAYDCHDDVTKEAVDKLRVKAAPVIEAEEWETIDGFGRVVHA